MRTLVLKGKDVKMIEKIGKSVLPIYYNHEELKMMLSMENYLLLKMMDEDDIIAFMILEKTDDFKNLNSKERKILQKIISMLNWSRPFRILDGLI